MAEIDVSEKGLTALPPIPADTVKVEASDNAITAVGPEIATAVNLEELLLYKNSIKSVDPAIGELKKLKTLNLFNNIKGGLAKLPWKELGTLSALEELNLAANKMMMVPDPAFAALSSLKILSLNDNRLVRLGSLAPCAALEELRVYNNNLEEMPVIGKCENLTIIEINNNRVAKIPSDYFANTPALERLVASKNFIEAVPASLASCSGLQFLQMQEQQEGKLAAFEEAAWGGLGKLETLFLQDNPNLAVPEAFGQCAALKRVNVGKAAPDALADIFKKLALNAPGGKYWDPATGKCEDSPVKA